MRVYLIRHGETDYNFKKLMQGHDPVPLNDRGIAQAACVAEAMCGARVDAIVSSDLTRAVMTASILAGRIAAPLTFNPAFRERDTGLLAGKPYAQAQEFFTDPHYAPENGETLADFEARVRGAFDTLAAEYAGTGAHVALVSHGMLCSAFAALYLGGPPTLEGTRLWSNASISTLDYDGAWRAAALNDCTHLDGFDPIPAGRV